MHDWWCTPVSQHAWGEAGASDSPGHAQLHTKFQVSLGYLITCLQNKIKTTVKATTKGRWYKTAAVPRAHRSAKDLQGKEVSGLGGEEAVTPGPHCRTALELNHPPPSLSKSICNEIICTNLWQINRRNHSCFETSVWNNCTHLVCFSQQHFNFPFCQHKKKVKHFYKMSQ